MQAAAAAAPPPMAWRHLLPAAPAVPAGSTANAGGAVLRLAHWPANLLWCLPARQHPARLHSRCLINIRSVTSMRSVASWTDCIGCMNDVPDAPALWGGSEGAPGLALLRVVGMRCSVHGACGWQACGSAALDSSQWWNLVS